MPLELQDAECPKDIPEITRLLWAAFTSPPQKHFLIYHPVLGTGPDARDEALQSSIARQLKRNANDPTERWRKIVDTDTGAIVAAALWNVYEDNPYADWEPMDVFWWPAGPQREYVNEYFRLHDTPLVELAARPHLMLKVIFTHPDQRGRGAATTLMRAGMRAADDRDWEVWLTSWGLATPFYERLGFETPRVTRVQPVRDPTPPEWAALDEKVQPATAYTQVRRRLSER